MAERLALMHPTEFPSVRALRERILQAIDDRVREGGPPAPAAPGREFHFSQSISGKAFGGLATARGQELFGEVTKAIHNALHGTPVTLTTAMRSLFLDVAAENAAALDLDADLVVIHDPQPVPLVTARALGVSGSGAAMWTSLTPSPTSGISSGNTSCGTTRPSSPRRSFRSSFLFPST